MTMSRVQRDREERKERLGILELLVLGVRKASADRPGRQADVVHWVIEGRQVRLGCKDRLAYQKRRDIVGTLDILVILAFVGCKAP